MQFRPRVRLEARRIGRLCAIQYRIGLVDVGGWDTHVNGKVRKGECTVRKPARAEDLRNVTGLEASGAPHSRCWSEFGRHPGRTNNGPDHGHGSVPLATWRKSKGGPMAGEHARVAKASLFYGSRSKMDQE